MPEKQVKNGQVALSYTTISGKSPALFFIHGTGSNRTIYNQYLKDLKGYQKIALDLRSHGKSSRGKMSLMAQVDDCIKILKKEKIKNLVIIANSSGSNIACQIAKKFPVRGLVLASHYSREYVRLGWLIRPVFRAIAWVAEKFNSKRKLVYQNYWEKRNMPFWKFFFIDIRGTSYTAWFRSATEALAHPADLRSLKTQGLVLQGSKDPLIKIRRIRNHCSENKLLDFKRVKTHHHILTQEYDYSLKLIKDFIKRISNG